MRKEETKAGKKEDERTGRVTTEEGQGVQKVNVEERSQQPAGP